MIPKQMEASLRAHLPERTWQNRLFREEGRCYMEFGSQDVDRLRSLGIEVDNLGPRLVVCTWDEASPLEVGGYLVVDNLAMGRPSMGGIRMLPDLTPSDIYYLGRGMTLKNAAAALPFGGGKSGIVCAEGLSPHDHSEVVRRFARLIYRYRDIYIPGPDVGTDDTDMKTVAIENGLDCALSKTVDMGGNRIDELGAAAGGLVIALDALLDELHRLRILPQFAHLLHPRALTVLIQGFGAVGAHTARILPEILPEARIIGLSDASGYLFNEDGLPVERLFQMWKEHRLVARSFFLENLVYAPPGAKVKIKYSNQPDDLLRESAFCLIPAAPVANYLDTDPATHPCMTVERMGHWTVIIEGANTYSPDPARKAARARMERAVYRERGVLIATDYLVNSGGVIYAAQERWVRTPDELRIPVELLGKRDEVEKWLKEHAAQFEALAAERMQKAEAYRDEVIRGNMRELVELLVSDTDMLPCEASEQISIRRIASRESHRTAADIMESIPTISSASTAREAAALLVEAGCPILAVINPQGGLAGVVTEWDITRATAEGSPDDQPVEAIMTRQVISATPSDTILEMVRKLEINEISAMPVVEKGGVLGMVSSDLLARKSLLGLLQTQEE